MTSSTSSSLPTPMSHQSQPHSQTSNPVVASSTPSTSTSTSASASKVGFGQRLKSMLSKGKSMMMTTHSKAQTVTSYGPYCQAKAFYQKYPQAAIGALLMTSFMIGLFSSLMFGALTSMLMSSMRYDTFKASAGSPESHAHRMLDMQIKHHRQQHSSMTDSWLPESLGGTSESSHKIHPKDLSKFIQRSIKTSGAGSGRSSKGSKGMMSGMMKMAIPFSSHHDDDDDSSDMMDSHSSGISSYLPSMRSAGSKAESAYGVSKMMPSFMGGSRDDDDESSSWSSYVPGMKPKHQSASWTNWLTFGMIGRSGKPMKSKSSSSSSGGLSSMIPSFMSHDQQQGMSAHDAKELQRLLHQSQRKVRSHDDY